KSRERNHNVDIYFPPPPSLFVTAMTVLFVHNYSGEMNLDVVLAISLSYFLSTTTVTYAQYLAQGFPEPSVDLKYLGCLLFLIGISGNFYHHYLLSKIRSRVTRIIRFPKADLWDFSYFSNSLCILVHHRVSFILDWKEPCYEKMFSFGDHIRHTYDHAKNLTFAFRKGIMPTFGANLTLICTILFGCSSHIGSFLRSLAVRDRT
ncbi:3-oxo-5-alpha-steroid 4-dehydrogenase family protein, partial [Prunus dulcis]